MTGTPAPATTALADDFPDDLVAPPSWLDDATLPPDFWYKIPRSGGLVTIHSVHGHRARLKEGRLPKRINSDYISHVVFINMPYGGEGLRRGGVVLVGDRPLLHVTTVALGDDASIHLMESLSVSAEKIAEAAAYTSDEYGESRDYHVVLRREGDDWEVFDLKWQL